MSRKVQRPMFALAIICLHDLVMGFSSFPSGGRGGLCDSLSGGQSCSPVTFATSPCKLMTGHCKTLYSIEWLRDFDRDSISKPINRGDPDACWMVKDDFNCDVAYMERKDSDGTVLGYSVCESRTLGNGRCVCRAKVEYYCSLECSATSSLDRCQEVPTCASVINSRTDVSDLDPLGGSWWCNSVGEVAATRPTAHNTTLAARRMVRKCIRASMISMMGGARLGPGSRIALMRHRVHRASVHARPPTATPVPPPTCPRLASSRGTCTGVRGF
eukprot:CAMPEP_0183331176 /NCGR_PEP_ID=MMETSP0164_2-20130417/576_1 /TAXON_ID=221442 /ORGANISM="Coccolithus pelagicus ssp braarudi, Strain PLY182g" /LENGTH=271 /DNA_ID=CAMNT_0025499579 /DNA_START=109 /DNA_END=925 /DNA_ORIENTATION=-